MPMHRQSAFSLLELLIAMIAIVVLLSVLLPGLSAARDASHRDVCANNQRRIAIGWFGYIEDHNDRLPLVLTTPWQYGGCRFNVATNEPRLDVDRPLTAYLPMNLADPSQRPSMFFCPADTGIRGTSPEVGTSGRTAFRAYGTSYRANHSLLNARTAGLDSIDRAISRSEILTSPARLVLMGDATWHETWAETGRTADWHGVGESNLLFMDGSVRYRHVKPRSAGAGPVSFEPQFMPKDIFDFDFAPTR